jgi:hypothetical protein
VGRNGGGYHQWEVSADEAVTFRKVSIHSKIWLIVLVLKGNHGTGGVRIGSPLRAHGTFRQSSFAFDPYSSFRPVTEDGDPNICHPGILAVLLHTMSHRENSDVHAYLDLLVRSPERWLVCQPTRRNHLRFSCERD